MSILSRANILCMKKACLTASVSAVYSASIEENVTVVYTLDAYMIGPLERKNT